MQHDVGNRLNVTALYFVTDHKRVKAMSWYKIDVSI